MLRGQSCFNLKRKKVIFLCFFACRVGVSSGEVDLFPGFPLGMLLLPLVSRSQVGNDLREGQYMFTGMLPFVRLKPFVSSKTVSSL